MCGDDSQSLLQRLAVGYYSRVPRRISSTVWLIASPNDYKGTLIDEIELSMGITMTRNTFAQHVQTAQIPEMYNNKIKSEIYHHLQFDDFSIDI